MLADLKGKNPDDHSPTEKAGMCSHWELIRRQSESDERFLIMEHDTYLLPEHHARFALVGGIVRVERAIVGFGATKYLAQQWLGQVVEVDRRPAAQMIRAPRCGGYP